MELVLKIFETLGITPLAVLQMAITVALAVTLSVTLVRPILKVFEERDARSTRPLEESKRFLAEAEAKAREYEEALRAASAQSLARKRGRMEEVSRAERKAIEAAAEESNRQIEEVKARIVSEKDHASSVLRDEVARLSTLVAEKVLGRIVA